MKQEKWNSVWGHIGELRLTFLRSFAVIAVGFMVALIFYEPLMRFLTAIPMENSSISKNLIQRVQIRNQSHVEQIFELPPYSSILSDPYSHQEKIKLAPGQSLTYEQILPSSLLVMGPIEGLTLVLKVCFWLSIAFTAPIWGWIWLKFILPGLHAHEKAALISFQVLSLICLSCGGCLAYFVTLPIANEYLTLFNQSLGQNTWTLTHYVNYVLFLGFGHAVAAELGLILMLLVHFRFLTPEWLISKRRIMIVVAFILGALLTPPDVLTQLLLAFPFIALYELAIWYAKRRCVTSL